MKKEYFKVKEIVLDANGNFKETIHDKCYKFEIFDIEYIYCVNKDQEKVHDLSDILVEYKATETCIVCLTTSIPTITVYTLLINDDVAVNSIKKRMIVDMNNLLQEEQRKMINRLNLFSGFIGKFNNEILNKWLN